MKLVSAHRGRPLRWLLVLLFVGGGVLAAENNWLTTLRVGSVDLTTWLAHLAADAPAEKLVLSAQPVPAADTTSATNPWLNTALFSPAATGWTLYSARPASGSPMKSQQVSTTTVPSALPTAFFSSGFISYSSGVYGPVPNVVNVSGIWSSNGAGLWSTSTNWSAGIVADGAGNTADFSALNITTDVAVTLDTSRTIGNLSVGDTDGTHHYIITASGSSTLTFDSNVAFTAGALVQTANSAGDAIAVPMRLDSSLDVNNHSAMNEFHLIGNIAAGGNVSASQTLWFNHAVGATGPIRVSGVISDGGTGGQLGVVVGGGVVTFTGTNTYHGSTSVDNGTLLINGDNSGATGTVFVSAGGTLGGTGQIGASVYTFGGTITGADSTSVGMLTLQGDLNLFNGEVDGIYLANLSGSLSDLLAITGTMFLGGDSELHIVGGADGHTTYTLATFAAHDDVFDPMLVSGIPSGYELVYNDMSLQLVPIPEPATWIGGALALGAIGFVSRRRRLQRRA